ncbi:unnamed protein product [Gordionus sp. m RMFG-2023]|uniref:2-hydroxy-1,4-benzoquinone reductase-like n=1 Tax=Gordionus sp. m RMFG-2023 TaxID=3053472 RepID=UPI0030E0E6A5
MPLKYLVILGSVRDNRNGLRVSKFILEKLSHLPHEFKLLDPLELNLPLVRTPLHFFKDPKEAPQILHSINKDIVDSDAFLIVTPEYNQSIPPALSNLLNYFPPASYAHKPSAICCYSISMFGGIRCSIQLRGMLIELGSVSIPSLFSISKVTEALNEDGTANDKTMDERCDKFLKQLEWYAMAIKEHKKTIPPS